MRPNGGGSCLRDTASEDLYLGVVMYRGGRARLWTGAKRETPSIDVSSIRAHDFHMGDGPDRLMGRFTRSASRTSRRAQWCDRLMNSNPNAHATSDQPRTPSNVPLQIPEEKDPHSNTVLYNQVPTPHTWKHSPSMSISTPPARLPTRWAASVAAS